MRRALVTLWLVFFLFAAYLWVIAWPLQIRIDSPRMGQPVVLKPGETFQVHYRQSLPLLAAPMQVWVRRGHQVVQLPVLQQQGLGLQRSLKVQVPESFSEVVNLNDGNGFRVRLTTGTQQTEREQAVFVRESFPARLQLIHLADMPIYNGSDHSRKIMQQMIAELNLLQPDLVMVSGDLAKGGQWNQYDEFLYWMRQLQMPLYFSPGNHAYDGWGGYLTQIGAPFHWQSFADWCVFSLNSGHGRDQFTRSQMQWFAQSLEQCPQPNVIIQLHHPLFQQRHVRSQVPEFLQLIKTKNTPLVLSGHWHQDAAMNDRGEHLAQPDLLHSGTRFLVTTTAGDDLRSYFAEPKLYHGYRRILLQEGNSISHGTPASQGLRSLPWGSVSVEKGKHGLAFYNRSATGLRLTHYLKSEKSFCPSTAPVQITALSGNEYQQKIELDIGPETALVLRQSGEGLCQ